MIIDHEAIERMLANPITCDYEIERILDKSERFEGLTPEEVASLLAVSDKPRYLRRIFDIAGKIKKHIYGDRVVIFAPLYISDHCVNKCTYCGFSCDNKFARRKLTQDEIRREVEILERMGHKRLALEAGESPRECPIEYVTECMSTIYGMQSEGQIRRVNVNIAATTVENYRALKDAGIGTYILFQETYHRPTYEKAHLAGPKSNYDYHLTAFDRAMEGGIDDVGGGVLFGLYDPNYEVLGLMFHNQHLEERFGAGFHTISSPRLCAADGMDMSQYPHILSDEDFLRIVAIIRIAVPYTGMIISTRESPEMRRGLINIGISQMSAGSSVDVGGYSAREGAAPSDDASQFRLADDRPAGEIITWLMDEGLIPSFCTACYRSGRTGDRFMQLARSGNIKNVCLPNGLMTLLEYALDYGDDDFRAKADKVIESQLSNIASDKVRALTEKNIARLRAGERDLYL